MTEIQGPYRVNPEFDACIQTADGKRDIAMIMPDFSFTTGVSAEEHVDTLKLLAASWDMRELLRQVQSENSILSDATVEDIDDLLKGLA